MSRFDFNKDLDSYIKQKKIEKPFFLRKHKSEPKVVAPTFKKRKFRPILSVKKTIRKIRMLFRKLSSFLRGDNNINLNDLGREVVIIRKEDTPFGSLMAAIKTRLLERKVRKTTEKRIASESDVDMSKVAQTIEQHAIRK